MRCFVGAFVAAESARGLQAEFARRLTAAAGRRGRQLRTVPAENLHVTLKFLGDTSPPRAAEALACVAALGGHALEARALRFSGFPRPAAARVAVAELDELDELAAWSAALQRRLGPEDRAFRPHVTLARTRLPVRFEPQPLDVPLLLQLAAPALYRSDQADHGVRYRPVTEADLSDRDGP